NTLNCAPHKKRVGKFIGYKSKYKKAIVTLAPDDSITLFPDL
ncbi:MAG: 50S ribosomal protein L23, partial [Symploca sp. SIO2B6]|nr:50S ribosomal protein L23 [Symploca sp. SIO2B6]